MIELRNVYKIFGDDPRGGLAMARSKKTRDGIFEETGRLIALRNVSLKVKKGETFVIMGLSGSGKSTLIRLLNRLMDPTSGTISVAGEDVTRYSARELLEFRRHKISMVFQRFALLPHKNVLDNVAFGLACRGVGLKERRKTARLWLDNVGLEGFHDARLRELSGGMQQRVGLARALAVSPEIILMDEPFSALDPLIRHDMQNLLIDLQKRLGKTIVFVTHDLDEALRLGDRICILESGVVQQIAKPEEIVVNPANRYVTRFIEKVDFAKVMTAKALTNRNIVKMTGDATVGQARKKLARHPGVNVASICRGRKLRGYVPASVLEESPDDAKLADLMAVPQHVDADRPLAEFLDYLLETIPYVAVIENDRFYGWVSKIRILELITRSQGSSHRDKDARSDRTP